MSGVWAALMGLGGVLAQHVILAACAIGLGIAVALPLAVWASRSQAVSRAALGFASLVQTIPALALLALFFPILLSLRAVFGEDLPTLGFLPALLALALYALLPILRNAVTAQTNLDPGVIEAADGVGMSFWQRLRLVEAPLTAPYIMAGIRTAAVWTIGAATLATTIGQPSLGDPIFAGLQTQNWSLVLAGCIASAGLAIIADALLGTIEAGFRRRDRRLWLGGAIAVAIGVAAAFVSQVDWSRDDGRDTVVIGTKQFSEQLILGRLVGAQLEEAGYNVEYREGLGSAVVAQAVADGSIDLYFDYTGTIWANQMKRTDNPSRDAMYEAIRKWEREVQGTRVLGKLGFENAYAFAMREDRANELGIRTIEDLARAAPQLVAGGDPEWFERPEWFAVRDAYGLKFANQRNFSPTFMYDALRSSEADVITAYTSDGRIAADRLRVLEDPREALPSYDTLIILSPERANDERLLAALRPLLGTINVEAMREANFSVDRTDGEKKTPREAASWLAKEVGLE